MATMAANSKGEFLEPDYGAADTSHYVENWDQPSLEPSQTTASVHLSYLKNFFDLDTSDFLLRCRRALFPIGKKILDNPDNEEADIYGWVWIPTTVILVLSVNSSLFVFFSALFHQQDASVSHISGVNFRKFWIFSVLVYGYNIVIPAILWGVLVCTTSRQPILHLFCIYGYSCTSYIFASLISIIPFEVIYIVSFVIASIVSSITLFRNIFSEDEVSESTRSLYLFKIIATLLHVAFGIGLLMVFLYGT
ncbi:hypothetical protein GpartN1_g3361.t1 [Galdieria partita]|uniref:Protein YIPF n=1 Tax=Galdieria partita TaxID=83374 RepID=A0A9C7PVV6_9RHOD|nr:hypothetical protein GpartN1_g3361.t1 [Galdieria partita]